MVFLFIFESIGTSELILIGIIALIFLGPRRLPEMARKLGKIMADFRTTTNEFKQTWEREVNFEEEARAIRTGELSPASTPTASDSVERESLAAPAPEVKAIDASAFSDDALLAESRPEDAGEPMPVHPAAAESEESDLSDKKNWL